MSCSGVCLPVPIMMTTEVIAIYSIQFNICLTDNSVWSELPVKQRLYSILCILRQHNIDLV